MKKDLTLLIVFFGIVLIAGCSKNTHVDNPELAENFKNAPEWVLGSEDKDATSAVGAAKIGKAGRQFARTEALAQARSELARQMSVTVKDLVTNFVQQIGMGDAQTVDRVSKQVSKQVSYETLIGSMEKDLWISPDLELYVLVVIDADYVKQSIQNNVQSSFRNDDAQWQQLQSKNGIEELDLEIEKEFGN